MKTLTTKHILKELEKSRGILEKLFAYADNADEDSNYPFDLTRAAITIIEAIEQKF